MDLPLIPTWEYGFVNGTVRLTVGEPPEEATGIRSELSETQACALAYFFIALFRSFVSEAASSKSFLSSSPTLEPYFLWSLPFVIPKVFKGRTRS